MLKCPLCEGAKLQTLFEADNAFVSVGDLAYEPYSAGGGGNSYCKGDLKLELKQCLNCAYIFNSLFDRVKMQKAYFNDAYITPQNISKTMSSHIINLSQKIKFYIDSDSVLLEIAPGGCDLVRTLAPTCHFFYTIDPSHTPQKLLANEKNIKHIHSLFDDEKLKSILEHKIDFVIFRHLLEHIDTPKSFLESVVRLLENDAMIYIEVPNVEEIFENARFYEIRHEHCGYYDKATLCNALALLGCELVDDVKFYDGQWIGLFFKKTSKSIKTIPITFYDANLSLVFNTEISKLEALLEPFKNVAIYGAGGHANSLITYLSEASCYKIKCAIDKDARRIGTYLQNSNIIIKSNEPQNLQGIECVLMCMPCYESIVFEKELKNHFKGKVILSAKGIQYLSL
ncbi:class I SAM-dependent methyltransferase [Campylobacter upsaliensis]|uniref:class I SAM-dependent methyltransferase n=1 Tax=Campylobacter upsaliensis TaxID=28080 RepID=UPI002149ED35|nr:class I SAM-dependent methyltransferase [Campylobacter upsaliensis]MCR2124560.1 class I SAM-dependent methyltransferase [Campylobacter upsaliensis]